MADEQPAPAPSTITETTKRWTWITWILFCGFASVCSILSYWYGSEQAKPQLTYRVDPTRTQIFRAGEDSGLKVTYAGKEVESDVSSMQVAIWNAGGGAVKADQVLEDMKAKFSGSGKILSVKIISQSRKHIEAKVESDSESDRSAVLLGWRILEEGDGFVLQVIYEGGGDIDCEITGVVEGQPQILEAKLRDKSRVSLSIMIAVTAFGLAGLFHGVGENFKEPSSRRKGKASNRIFTALMVVALALVWGIEVYDFLSGVNAEPPSSISEMEPTQKGPLGLSTLPGE